MSVKYKLESNFTEKELRCSHCGELRVSIKFMEMLQSLRWILGFPLVIGSCYRCVEYDEEIGGKNVHPKGEAVDIVISGERAYHVARVGFMLGFTGIGIRQKGEWGKRIIHLDRLKNSRDHPRPRLWTY